MMSAKGASGSYSSLSLGTKEATVSRAEGDDNKSFHQAPPPRRKNLPGKNSYLKVLLDQNTLQQLHEATLELQKHFSVSAEEGVENVGSALDSTTPQPPAPSSTSSPTDRSESSSSDTYLPENNSKKLKTALDGPDVILAPQQELKKKEFRLRPRALESLHMTLFFGGETLCNDLSAEELQTWYLVVQRRLSESHFFLQSTVQQDETSPSATNDGSFWFRLSHFRTFPPRRNYLVVAIFEASPAWHSLYRDIRQLSAATAPALQEITKYSKDTWVPHVTLANLQGNGPSKKELVRLLQELPLPANQKNCMATGITMGGPVPLQVDLNWNFAFHEGPVCAEPTPGGTSM
jgi:2'-5' RNA ligase